MVKNKSCSIFWVGDDFINNITLQLLYHNDMINCKNGNYESIIFHNILWDLNQTMLE